MSRQQQQQQQRRAPPSGQQQPVKTSDPMELELNPAEVCPIISIPLSLLSMF